MEMRAITSEELGREAAEDDVVPDLMEMLIKYRRRLLWSFIIGMVCGLIGTALGAISLAGFLWLHPRIDVLGILLIVASFVLLLLAADCLDKMREIKRQQIAYTLEKKWHGNESF